MIIEDWNKELDLLRDINENPKKYAKIDRYKDLSKEDLINLQNLYQEKMIELEGKYQPMNQIYLSTEISLITIKLKKRFNYP